MNDPAGQSARSPLALPLAVLAAGALSIVLLVASVRLHREAVVEDLALARAVGQLQADVAICHLWLEELVSGDDVDLDEIRQRLERSQRTLDIILGAAPHDDTLELRRLPEDARALRAEATSLRGAFDEFRQISEDRRLGYERDLPVGIGSDFDIEYDRVFRRLLEHAADFETELEQRRRESRERDTRHLVLLATAWGLGLLFTAVGLWSRERRRRRAEQALAASREHLERSHTLEALGRLARGLAHDLNNYLAAIRAQSELVATRTTDDDTRSRARTVVGTVEKASGLLERLLAFGRSEPERVGPVDLNRLLRAMRDVLEATAGDDVRLALELQPRLPPVRIDPAHFDQLVLNLVVNARDAMPRGGTLLIETGLIETGRIETGRIGTGRIETDADPGTRGARLEVTLRVSDSGVGIPPEHLETIFEPFWSGKGGSHRGLGLSIVYGVVRRSAGRIDVRSPPGEGTTFEITFPASDQPTSVPQPTSDPATSDQPASGAADATAGHLLLVDDNEEYREATAALLETLGYEVTTADSAAAALVRLADDDRLEIALIDVVMPDLDGVELTRRLRILQPRLPVLLMSGDADAARARYGEVDGVEVLRKEASTSVLVAALRRHLGAKSTGAKSTGAKSTGAKSTGAKSTGAKSSP